MRHGRPHARRVEAMKATLSGDVFDDPDWIVERKLDGVRCLAFRDGGSVSLESRNRLSLNERYRGDRGGARRPACERFVIDGEVVGISAGARASRRCSGAGTTAG
jgi:ATP-dependent DNA ligase